MVGTGFDTQGSLELITNENINEIEQYVNENCYFIINTFYEQKTEFKFLPGHHALLSSFPRKIQIFKENTKDLNNELTLTKAGLFDLADIVFLVTCMIRLCNAPFEPYPRAGSVHSFCAHVKHLESRNL